MIHSTCWWFGLQEDGGDIFYVDFVAATGIVKVRLAGSCVGKTIYPPSSAHISDGCSRRHSVSCHDVLVVDIIPNSFCMLCSSCVLQSHSGYTPCASELLFASFFSLATYITAVG